MVVVVVTGVSGYIGSHVAKALLQKGYEVRGTVRSLADKTKVDHLTKICPEASNNLKLYEADLLKEGSFAECFEGSTYVMHTASPFQWSVEDPQRDLVDPAVKGTTNVLRQAKAAKSVKRVVVTSSMAAVCGDQVEKDPTHLWTEEDWNNVATIANNPYGYSKLAAERAAWELAKELNLDIVTINPSLVMGPPLSSRVDGTSVKFFTKLINGEHENGAPNSIFGMVDVRDVAAAHVLAIEKPNAKGRYICSQTSQYSLLQLADFLRPVFPDMKLPTKMNEPVKVPREKSSNNTKIQQELGLTFTPIATTVVDMAKAIRSWKE